jgi:DNA polymerase-3 subunit alpha
MNPIYIPLFNSTNLSHKTILTTKDLVNYGETHELPMIGIVEEMNFFSMLNFSFTAINKGIKPVIGCCVNLFYEKKIWGNLIIFIKNERGFFNFSKVMSDGFRNQQFYQEKPYMHLEDLMNIEDIIVVLTKDNNFHTKLINNDNFYCENFLNKMKNNWPNNLYLTIDLIEEKNSYNHKRIKLADLFHIPLVYYHLPLFPTVEKSLSYHVFDCIIKKNHYDEDEFSSINNEKYGLISKNLIEQYGIIPEALENTFAIGIRCNYLPKKSLQVPPYFIENDQEEQNFLKQQAIHGLKILIKDLDPSCHLKYFDRLNMELEVIISKNFSGYFLIVADFINWAKNHNIPVGPGRGSGAGSIIAWSLGITDIDPIEFGLIFERFLNPERVSMPDFDIDFDPTRRDEILNYVTDKYGVYNCGHIITFGLMKAKMVIRDVGRVLGFSYFDIDRIAKIIPNDQIRPVKLGEVLVNDSRMAQLYEENEKVKKLIDISLTLEGFPRTVSVHAAGYVISNKPLYQYAPFYMDREGGSVCVQLNMHQVEEVGLIKFDFLSLKTLTICNEIHQLVLKTRNEIVPFHNRIFNDKPTYELISTGLSSGIFQLESTGIQEVVIDMRPDNIEDITALISLFRPGPISHIPTFIARKHGLESIEYLHPCLEEILKPTYGVIVYQEQVMAITRTMASYSMGRADIVRKAMGKKKPEEMEKQQKDFIAGSVANGIDAKIAYQIWDQITVFAGYAFNKAHAAAYGVITYNTAYLKAHYMEEFYTIILNNDIHNHSQLLIFIIEFRKFGGIIESPNINYSDSLFKISGNKKIIYGLTGIRGVGVYGDKIFEERDKNGLYISFQQFLYRHKEINKKVLKSLIYSGCFDTFDKNRCKLMTIGEIFLETKFAVINTMESKRWSLQTVITYEQEAFGFFLNKTPLDLFGKLLISKKIYSLKYLLDEVNEKGDSIIKCAAVLETLKKRKTSKGTSYAFLSLMDGNNNIEMTAFSKILSEKYDVLRENNLIIFTVHGRKENDKYRFSLRDAESIDNFLTQNYYNIIIKIKPQDNLKNIIDLLQKENQTSQRRNVSIIFQGYNTEYHLSYFVHYSKNLTDELDNLGCDYFFDLL